jgi:glycogen(starch) synthase
MRILMVSNLYPPIFFGGYEILCAQVADEFSAKGHQVGVLTSDFRAPECAPDSVRRKLKLTTNFPLPGEKVGQVDFKLSSLQRVGQHNYRETLAALEEFQPDIVFAWCLSRLSLAPIRAAQSRGIPVAYTINDLHPRQFLPARWSLSPKSWLKALAEPWLWPLATMRGGHRRAFPITIISQATRRQLLEMGLPIAHSRVIHQGIPLQQFDYQERTGQDPVRRLLYVGQLSQNKGVHTLILALAGLREREDWHLTVVGEGVPDYEQHLRTLVARSSLESRIDFVGRRPHREVAEFYAGSHILIFPSEWEEPFGLTHLEAMASGCAVISTLKGGCAELIVDGENALAYQAADSVDLQKCLIRLLDDEPLRQNLVRFARRYVERHHDLSYYVAQLEEFLQAAQREHRPWSGSR